MPATRVQGVPAGTRARRSGAADRASPGRAPHAAVDARRHRGDAGAEPISPPRRSTRAAHAGDDKARCQAQRRADLLIPVVKAWCTDLGVEIASTGVQVHGGMGYIEETGAAQYLPRRADRADLRGHQRHPGRRSGRPQARPRRRRGGARAVRRDAPDPVRDRRPGGMGGDASRPRRGARRARTRDRPSCRSRSGARRRRIVALSGAVRHGGRRLADGAPCAGRRASRGRRGRPNFAAAKRATARFYAEHYCRAPRPFCRRSRAARRWSISIPICFSGRSGKSLEIAGFAGCCGDCRWLWSGTMTFECGS